MNHIKNTITSNAGIFEFSFVAMTTECNVKLCADTKHAAQKCFHEIFNNTFRLERKYNFYDRKSYLSKKVNNRKNNTVSLDTETLFVFQKIREYSEATNGVFDITVGTLKACFKLDELSELQTCIDKNRAHTGLEAWSLSKKKLKTRDSQTLFDLGGVIKEYAVDEAAKIAKKYGIKAALIDYGGDIYGYGCKPDGNPFTIGIKNPKNLKEYIFAMPLSNQALTTSASYERNTKIEGEIFSHIIGKDYSVEIISSSVISKSALTSGIYSTVFMLAKDIDIPEELGVILVDDDMNIHQNILD